MDVDHIDLLLEKYLHLLHEYTTLRAELNGLQAGMYQNIARANFSAERGMRYDQDFYDDRMQASRRLSITSDDNQDAPTFHVFVANPAKRVSDAGITVHETEEGGTKDKATADDTSKGEQTAKPVEKKDPLLWFGLLAPMALRHAQGQSIKAVEKIVPKLVSINAEMEYLEIEVRRARKKHAKAEAAAKKQLDHVAGKEIVA